MANIDLSRRQFINLSVASAGLYALMGTQNLVLGEETKSSGVDTLFGGTSKIPYIGITEDGPLYPPSEIPWLKDLTAVGGEGRRAQGQLLYVFGQILDVKGRPISGAAVELWQADNEGQYRHPRAPGQHTLDPNFGYFGKVKTGEDGTYLFKTIRPHSYTIFGMPRAPHLHLKMRHLDHGVLTTEMYFADKKDDAVRQNDRVFKSRFNPDRLVVASESPQKYSDLGIAFDQEALCCKYDLAFLL